jgi:hypothetical protein
MADGNIIMHKILYNVLQYYSQRHSAAVDWVHARWSFFLTSISTLIVSGQRLAYHNEIVSWPPKKTHSTATQQITSPYEIRDSFFSHPSSAMTCALNFLFWIALTLSSYASIKVGVSLSDGRDASIRLFQPHILNLTFSYTSPYEIGDSFFSQCLLTTSHSWLGQCCSPCQKTKIDKKPTLELPSLLHPNWVDCLIDYPVTGQKMPHYLLPIIECPVIYLTRNTLGWKLPLKPLSH